MNGKNHRFGSALSATQERREAVRSHAERGNEGGRGHHSANFRNMASPTFWLFSG